MTRVSRAARVAVLPLLAAGLLFLPGRGAVRAARAEAPARPVIDEFSLTAAFVFNFTKFTQWPAAALPDSILTVGVAGSAPLRERLARLLEEREVGGRRLAVREFGNPAEVGACRVLFVARSQYPRLAEIRRALAGQPVLLIGEGTDFLERGGMIQLHLNDNRMRFDVNVAAVDSAGLQLSAQVLQLAGRVVGLDERGR